ncbi:DUF6879 family protein [Streptomyces sp. NPDC056010]|uniref:DUF6879 family protein n=1 Tax=Streptomyces sp. NPDC056010 TaxID=3345679 RepID=UPI0035E005C0
MTCRRRPAAWNEAGIWDQLHLILLARLRAAKQLDWSRAVIDSSHVRVARARIVSEPVSEYTRYLHDNTCTNAAAGELVRWLPRRRASDVALPGNDFWLFDGRRVQWNHFAGDGSSQGPEVTKDPAAVKLCADAFEAVWVRATPHDQYEIR